MTPQELRALLHGFDADEIDGHPLYFKVQGFGLWWFERLPEAEQRKFRRNRRSCWGDLRATVPDEELMFLWACFLM